MSLVGVTAVSTCGIPVPPVTAAPEDYRSAADPFAPGAVWLLLVVGLVGVTGPWLVVIVTLLTGTELPELRPRSTPVAVPAGAPAAPAPADGPPDVGPVHAPPADVTPVHAPIVDVA